MGSLTAMGVSRERSEHGVLLDLCTPAHHAVSEGAVHCRFCLSICPALKNGVACNGLNALHPRTTTANKCVCLYPETEREYLRCGHQRGGLNIVVGDGLNNRNGCARRRWN